MTPQEREDLRAKFTEVEDWLYEEGMDLDAKAYEKKRAELEKLAAPVFLRKSELEARPKVVSQAREATNWTESILEAWVSERPEVTAEEREKVLGMISNFTTWLDEMETQQEALPLHETPALTSREVSIKLEPIEREVHLLLPLLPPPSPLTIGGTSRPTLSASCLCRPRACARVARSQHTSLLRCVG